MIDFLIKSSASLAILLAFYHFVMEREKMHHFNRFYLLGSIVISFALPFLKLDFDLGNLQNKIIPNTINVIQLKTIFITQKSNIWPNLFYIIYAIISCLFLFRFGKNIFKMISKIKSNTKVRFENATLVLVEEKIIPHTFLNYIFINREDYESRKIESELFTHELTHVGQKHTLDILFIEFLKTIFWFNPILIFYKKAIQLNHEFLADEKVITSYNNVPFYQNLLLEKALCSSNFYLASNLNYLVTKKRLIMMTKSTSKSRALLKKITVVPILAGLLFSCVQSDPKTATTTNPEVWVNGKKVKDSDMNKPVSHFQQTEEIANGTEADLTEPQFPGGMTEFTKYIANNFKIPANASSEKLMISFIVEKDGSLVDINIKNNDNQALKNEAIRLLKNSPKWTAAKLNNKSVRYQLVLPIQLEAKKRKQHIRS